MSLEVKVDAVTFIIARVLTAGTMALVGGVLAATAADKLKLVGRLRLPLIYALAIGVGVASFLLGWASVKISIVIGIVIAAAGVALAFDRDAPKMRAAKIGGGVALLAAGTGWVGWNLYLMFG